MDATSVVQGASDSETPTVRVLISRKKNVLVPARKRNAGDCPAETPWSFFARNPHSIS